MKILISILPFLLATISSAQNLDSLDSRELHNLGYDALNNIWERCDYKCKPEIHFYYSVNDDEYNKALIKIDKALNMVKEPVDLKTIDKIRVGSFDNLAFYVKERQVDFLVSANASIGELVGLFSRNITNEPLYQKEKQFKRKATLINLKYHFPDKYKLIQFGQNIICKKEVNPRSHDNGFSYDKNYYQKRLVNVGSSHKIQKLEYMGGEKGSGVISQELKLFLEIQSGTTLEVYAEPSIYGYSYSSLLISSIKNNETIKIKVEFDSMCEVLGIEDQRFSNEKFSSKQSFSKYGNIIDEVFRNKEVKPLERINNDCGFNRPFEKIKEIAKRKDRVLLTILDSGVDYNHPELAYKIKDIDIDYNDPKRLKRERLISDRKKIKSDYKEMSFFKKALNYYKYYKKINQVESELKSIAFSWDFDENDSLAYDFSLDEEDCSSHGTHVAGIAVMGTDDIAILPLGYSRSQLHKWYEAIAYAYSKGSRIVNVSLGTTTAYTFESLERAMTDYPEMLFVVAAGNHSLNLNKSQSYPASYKNTNMLVVAALSKDNPTALADFSNFGTEDVDIVAPGTEIESLDINDKYKEASGTSMAAPYVSRIAARLKFEDPSLSPEEIIDIIKRSSIKVPDLKEYVKFGSIASEEKALEFLKNLKNE